MYVLRGLSAPFHLFWGAEAAGVRTAVVIVQLGKGVCLIQIVDEVLVLVGVCTAATRAGRQAGWQDARHRKCYQLGVCGKAKQPRDGRGFTSLLHHYIAPSPSPPRHTPLHARVQRKNLPGCMVDGGQGVIVVFRKARHVG